MSHDFIIITTTVWHGKPKPAKLLAEGDHILFGGKVWIISDAKFKDKDKYPNDLEISMYHLHDDDEPDKRLTMQTITVDREFEVQPLIVSVSPRKQSPKNG